MRKSGFIGNRSGGVGGRRAFAAALTAAVASALAACGGGGANGPINVMTVAPYTGPDAPFGPYIQGGCQIAVHAINDAGGVLGHQLKCGAADTRGDPADAVPAVRQMLATKSNIGLVLGATSDEASAVVPVLTGTPVVVFASTGQASFNNNTSPYFYRLPPADEQEAVAMAATAQSLGYHKVALVFGNDVGSQSFVAPATAALGKAGIQVVKNVSIDLAASSYRTEVAEVLASHPDAIMTETVGTAATALLSELELQNGGSLLPIIGTNDAVGPDYWKAVTPTVGAAKLAAAFHAATIESPTNGAGVQAFNSALAAVKSLDPTNYQGNPLAARQYDAVVLASLAMTAANSTDPKVFAPEIAKIANGGSGTTDVETYAQGIAALKAGKHIHYIGAGGLILFNKYNNNAATYQVVKYSSSGQVVPGATITPQQISALETSGN